jgi:hypothetical protein
VGESVADTAGLAPKMKSQACPLLNRASSAGSGLRFPLTFLLPCACPLSFEFFCLHIAAVVHVPGSPKTSPARCRVGCTPLSLASSFFVSLRRASCLPSPRPLTGSSLLMNPCHVFPGGTWCPSWPSTSAASPSVGVLDRQTYQGGTRGSRLCGGDRGRETENSKVRARTRDTRFIQVRAAKLANPTSCLGGSSMAPCAWCWVVPGGIGMCG